MPLPNSIDPAEIMAAVTAQNAVLCALCLSHPNPSALLVAFDSANEVHHKQLEADGKVSGMYSAVIDQIRSLIAKRVNP